MRPVNRKEPCCDRQDDVQECVQRCDVHRLRRRRCGADGRSHGLGAGDTVTLTSMLYRAARLSATGRAARKGPTALAKRMVRIQVGRAYGRSGIPRFPR